MIEKGLYYANKNFVSLIKTSGGCWDDTKRRPMVCLIKSSKNKNIFWAIPMGNYLHRTKSQQARIQKYLNYSESDIRSCYYHLGRTTAKSIFFVSDAIPITEKYIETEHKGADNKPFVIKNKKLCNELERKLYRILSIENTKPNYFRQHITDVYLCLEKELSKQDT